MTSPAPLFSVLTPVYNSTPDVLSDTVASVLAQTFADWELVLVDDASPGRHVTPLLARLAARDPRIRVLHRSVNGGISAASQTALDGARGTFVALLDHDDQLAPTALATMAEVVGSAPDVDYAYSDEDKLSADGHYVDAFAKPRWSPERLRSQMYTGHLSVLRTELVREVGGFDSAFDGSQDHDLVLRVTERARRIVHVPEILYHWRVVPGSTAAETGAKDYAWDAGRRAVAAHVEREGIDADVTFGDLPGTYRLHRRIPADLLVSIVIPSRGSSGLVWGQERCFVLDAVRAALENTRHRNIEIVAVMDTSTPQRVLDELALLAGDRLTLVPYDEPFNFSRKCNVGALHAAGEVLVMLNDDTLMTSADWLENLVNPLLDQEVGLTGAKLLYSDSRLQHGGHLYERGEYSHAFLYADPDSTVGFSALHIDREVVGVTAACAAIRAETYARIGGFNENLPGNFNDVDFCFKVLNAELRIVWMAWVQGFHFESRTRKPVVHEWEQEVVVRRWGVTEVDPYLPMRYTTPSVRKAAATALKRNLVAIVRAEDEVSAEDATPVLPSEPAPEVPPSEARASGSSGQPTTLR